MVARTALPAQLVTYWVRGKGGVLIAWGTPHDFYRCRVAINAAIVKGGGKPLPDHEISGLCASLHRIATGATPGHAPGE